MRLLDLREVTLAIVLMVPACSDDGIGPSDTNGGSDDGSSGGAPTTSVSTTSASASGGQSAEGSTPGSEGDSSAGSSVGTQSDSDTTDAPADHCTEASDCQVVDDCCNCMVIRADETPPPCGVQECFANACAPLGLPSAVCEQSSCEFAPVPCNPSLVACDEAPPRCVEGTLPSISEDTQCWTGNCVPAEACDVVPSCADCPDDEACIERVAQMGPIASCSPIDPSCGGVADCGCMGELCASPFDSCGESRDGLSCACPAC